MTASQRVPDAIVAGHICLDVIPRLRGPVRIEPGRLIELGPAVVSTGGAVANTGLALHRLGVPVQLMGKVGDDVFGRAVLEALTAEGVDVAGMIVAPGEATSYSIVINPPGSDRSFLHCPGANDTFSADDVRSEMLVGARLFHFGYPPLMREMYSDGGSALRRMLANARDAGPATSLDLCEPDPGSDSGHVDWVTLLAEALPLVDVFGPSLDELLFNLDRQAHERRQAGASLAEVVDRSRLAELGGTLLGMGAAVVAIKLGDQGLYVRTTGDASRLRTFCDRIDLDDEEWRGREVLSPCFVPRAVAGTTGAGDCTIAGFLAALLRGEAPADAATSATAVGACSVEALDATGGVPAWPRVAARLADAWPRCAVEIELGAGAHRDARGTLTFAAA